MLTDSRREGLSITFSIVVVLFTAYICHYFIPSLIWATIISMASFPLYRRFQTLFSLSCNVAAALFTLFITLGLIFPITWLLSVLIHETQLFLNHLMLLNQKGITPPDFLIDIPVFGDELLEYWHLNFGHAGGLKQWLGSQHLHLTSTSYYIKTIGASIIHRSIQLCFTLLSLFFFYRDGEALFRQVNAVGLTCIGAKRWQRFVHPLPDALQATVNGTVLVGLGVGVVMGISYYLLGFPAPALAGFFTAIAAMIPFVVPVVFLFVAAVLWAGGSWLAAVILLAVGTLVMFVADHFVKPVLIGGNTQLPFLVVLFGILGGVETLGVLGLFLGPVVMVLFLSLWQEAQLK